MSCSTCLNSEKQPMRCVLDEDGKSLMEYLEEINSSLKKVKDVVDAPIDSKGLSGENISELLQTVINKVVSIQTSSPVFSQVFHNVDNQTSTLQETLVSILKRVSILEKRTTTSQYI